MLKTQKVFWWRTGCANTEGKLGKEPDGEMGSLKMTTYQLLFFGSLPNLHLTSGYI